jgi:hypothetical protein
VGCCANGWRSAARFAGALFLKWGAWQMTTTTEVSESLERVDTIINMLDEICDHMDGFSSAEEASLSMALCHAGNLRRSGRKQ